MKDFDRATELSQKDPIAYLNRGTTYYFLKDYENAVANYTTAISLKPDFIEASIGRAKANRELKNHQSANEDCERVIQLDPHNSAGYFEKCDTLFESGKIDEALQNVGTTQHFLNNTY